MSKKGPVVAADVAARKNSSNYPEPFRSRVSGRKKQVLSDVFGLGNFGVNRTTLEPGAMSALRHWHSVQDEFIYVISGHPVLVTDSGDTTLGPGMCMGFKAGEADGHHLVNRSNKEVVYLEIGDRLPDDSASYPDDDLKAVMGADGKWRFEHKDGSAY